MSSVTGSAAGRITVAEAHVTSNGERWR
jgi:hypothetical protein